MDNESKILSTRYLPMKNNKVIKISAEIKVVKGVFLCFDCWMKKYLQAKAKE